MPNSFSGNVSFTSSIDPNVLEEILNQKLLENSFEKQLGTLNRLIYDPNMSVWLEHLTRATQVPEIQYFTFLCFQNSIKLNSENCEFFSVFRVVLLYPSQRRPRK